MFLGNLIFFKSSFGNPLEKHRVRELSKKQYMNAKTETRFRYNSIWVI